MTPYRIVIECMHFAAEEIHVSFKLTILVLCKGVHETRVLTHLVFFIEANVLCFLYQFTAFSFVLQVIYTLLAACFCRVQIEQYKIIAHWVSKCNGISGEFKCPPRLLRTTMIVGEHLKDVLLQSTLQINWGESMELLKSAATNY